MIKACTHRSPSRILSTITSPISMRSFPARRASMAFTFTTTCSRTSSRPGIEAHTRALAGFGRRLQQIDPALLPHAEKVEHAIVASNIDARMHELETVRTWERNPQLYADALGTSLASQALFSYAPEAGPRPAHCLEAAADAAARPGGARQHPRLPRHLRQDRPRDLARRPEVHRNRSAARVLHARRPAHPRRPGRHVDGGGARDRRVRRLPGKRSGAAGEGVVPPRARELRAEAEARRRHHAERRSPAGDCAARAARSPGGIPRRGRAPERRRSRSPPGARAKEDHPDPGHARRCRAGAGQGAGGVSSAAVDRVAA